MKRKSYFYLGISFILFAAVLSCTDLFSEVTYKKIMIYFDSNGGSGTMNPQETYANTKTTLQKNRFTYNKYLFAGWSTSPDGEIEYLEEDPYFSSNQKRVYLYAKWIDIYNFMVPVPGAHVSGKGTKGVFIDGRELDVPDYSISRYEIPYEMWQSVLTWAINNGYKFKMNGEKGGRSPGGANSNPNGPSYQPVSNISWNDCIVWCNAFSEKEGLEPVYTYDGKLMKDANDTNCQNCAMDITKKGYRLPTEVEWEFAARGADPTDTENWNYTYPGTSTVNDAGWYDKNSSISNEYQTHTIGTAKKGTRQNIFDMGGNVREWCWDIYDTIKTDTPLTGPASSSSSHIRRGGSYDHEANLMEITNRTQSLTATSYIHCGGFRIACTGLVEPKTEEVP